jgi:tyrosine aminotransferase
MSNPASLPSPASPNKIPASALSKRVLNPIRKIVDEIKFPEDSEKELIPLTLGDPTVFGNYRAPAPMVDALMESVSSFSHNGYVHSAGTRAARQAIAKRYSVPNFPVTEHDVIIASGCSGALEIIVSGMFNPGDNIIVPNPGFSLYQTLAVARGVEVRYYNLLPEKKWEADLEMMEAQINSRTRGILVNNPSNPCGSVYSQQHLKAILEVAERHHLPIIADEIYGDMTFGDNKFHPLAALSTNVPIVGAGGLAKEFVVPGWRVGWVVVHDRHHRLEDVRAGFFSLSQLTLGANALVQSVIPAVLDPIPGSAAEHQLTKFRKSYLGELEHNCRFTVEALSGVCGIKIVAPQGAMYGMIEIKVDEFTDISDDVEFANKLLNEQSVFLLPGKCFGITNFVRIVFAAPVGKLRIAYSRIADFCNQHHVSSTSNASVAP